MKLLMKCPLFSGIGETDLNTLLTCISPTQKHYKKNQPIFVAGEPVHDVGIVLTGNVHIVQGDFWGNRTILATVEPGGLFGEAFSCAELDNIPVNVIAAKASEVLMIDYKKIINNCSSSCVFHTTLIKNTLRIMAKKNVMLTQKMEFLTRRTTRDKLLSYFSAQAQQAGSAKFSIPFNRQELAEYLSIDRSAMSNELSKMQNDGLLIYRKNEFELLQNKTTTIMKPERW